jgi:thiol-disulfide isomerase/thioredoxin
LAHIRYIFFIFFLFFAACDKSEQNPAPKITHYTLKGAGGQTRTITVSPKNISIQGSDKKVTLMLFFSSTCPACQAELEELKKLYKKYGDRIDIIALQLGGEPVEMPFFVSHDIRKNHEIAKRAYPILQAPASMPIPLLVVLKDNKYLIHYIGAAPLEMLQIDIKKALGE